MLKNQSCVWFLILPVGGVRETALNNTNNTSQPNTQLVFLSKKP